MKKMYLTLLMIVALVLVVGLGGGCGTTTSTSTLYDTPNWMPDGRIICGKLEVRTSQELYGGGISGSHSYVTAFYPSGTGEVNLFEVGIEGKASVTTCSPIGEMIAGINDGQIIISDYSGNQSLVPNTTNAKYLDWSPDATQLVYSDESRDLYIINRDCTGKTQIATSAEAVAWRVGNRIVYEDSVYNKIWITDQGGASKEVVVSAVSSMPQISNENRIIFRAAGDKINSISVSGEDELELFGGYDRTSLKLSFDGQKIVGGAFGDPGIWLINIDGTGYTKIR